MSDQPIVKITFEDARDLDDYVTEKIATLRAALNTVLARENIYVVLQMERDYSEGNPYQPKTAAGFVAVRLAADLRAALAGLTRATRGEHHHEQRAEHEEEPPRP